MGILHHPTNLLDCFTTLLTACTTLCMNKTHTTYEKIILLVHFQVTVPYLLEKGISEETTTLDLDRSMATFVPKLLVLPFTLTRSRRKVS